MAALATVDDLEVLTGTVADRPAAERLLEMSSTVAESHCRRSFAEVVDDQISVTLTGPSDYLSIPRRPVTALTSISGPGGGTVAPSRYTWTRAGLVYLTRNWWEAGTYDLVATHGYATIPDDIVLAVCTMAAQASSGVPLAVRSATEQVADTSSTVTYGSRVPSVTPEVANLLRPYRRTVNTVTLGR